MSESLIGILFIVVAVVSICLAAGMVVLIWRLLIYIDRERRGNRDMVGRMADLLSAKSTEGIIHDHEQGRILRGLQESGGELPEESIPSPTPMIPFTNAGS